MALFRDKIRVIRATVERYKDVPASVQKNQVFVRKADILIEIGDLIERTMSNGGIELYEVIDPGFHETFGSIPAGYQMDVKKIDTRIPLKDVEKINKKIFSKKENALKIIDKQMSILDEIVSKASRDEDFSSAFERKNRWKERTAKLLSENINEDEGVKLKKMSLGMFAMSEPLRNLRNEATMYIGFLKSLKEEIEEYPEDVLNVPIHTHISKEKTKNIPSKEFDTVFIVHGHDNSAKETVARFIDQIGLNPIILHEQASSSQTIMEKIESYGDVGYAVVLYTPCDFGGKSGEEKQPRARQNVVFEHGYFIGRLGRSKVTALVKGTVETPNDISGVVYIDLDDRGAWKMDIVKELRAAGFDVNHVF